MLQKRVAGRTGFELTEYGLGAWALGGVRYGAVDRGTAVRVCRQYVDIGGNYIDTARVYHDSERIIGEFLNEFGRRDSLIISSKSANGQDRSTVADIKKDLETSLAEVGTDYFDIYFLHQPPEDRETMNEALELLVRLKEQGKIRAMGASIKGPNVTEDTENLSRQYMDTGVVDVLQVVYSILRQRNERTISLARDKNIGIVARTTLESGLLTGTYEPGHRFPENDQRSRYKPENLDFVLQKVGELSERAVQPPYENLVQVALKFASVLDGVSSSIVGAQSPEEVKANARAFEMPSLSDELVDWLKKNYGGMNDRVNYY